MRRGVWTIDVVPCSYLCHVSCRRYLACSAILCFWRGYQAKSQSGPTWIGAWGTIIPIPAQLGLFMISSGGDCRLHDLYLKLLTYLQSTHISTGILRRLYKFTLLLSPNYFFLLPSPPSPPSIFPMAEALPSTAPTALRSSIVFARTMWKGYY